MNCANHTDTPAIAYCRTCGKPLCRNCSRDVRGVIYCEECLASHVSGTLPPNAPVAVLPGVPPQSGVGNPRLAAILGCIPGVGAMYNGEYAKGFIHVLIFATLIWMAHHVNGIFGLGIAAFYIYMPIEAYRTAKAREMGVAPPDPLGLNNLFGSPGVPPAPVPAASAVPVAEGGPAVSPGDPPVETECASSRVPVGAIILIGLGVLFLLDEIGMMHFDWIWRFWPIILIAIGIRILMKRQRRGW
jgi:LiaI-LiaF-like transmembrane region/B-box zinc finger